jgi:hypothetical protein
LILIPGGEVRDRLPPDSALLTFAGDLDDRLWTMVVTPVASARPSRQRPRRAGQESVDGS